MRQAHQTVRDRETASELCHAPLEAIARPRVLIIGSGVSGLLAAARLLQNGYTNVTIFEKSHEIGGTWRDNTYPGLRCDVPAAMFSFTMRPNSEYSQRFPVGEEIQKYLLRTCEELDLRRLIRFSTTVEAIHFYEGRWFVQSSDGGVDCFDLVICATGVLHHPLIPEIPGRNTFNGVQFHTARWNHDVSWRDKRVAVIGTGATAAQVVPELVNLSKHVRVFQRTPHWIFPMPNRRYKDSVRSLFRKHPALLKNVRFLYEKVFQWTFSRAVIGNRFLLWGMEALCRHHLRRKVKDPELRRKLTPSYSCGCKRLVFARGFYSAIQKDNATLVTDAITSIEPGGIRTQDGKLHEVDVIVYATGFHGHSYMRPMKVFGKDGLSVDDAWKEAPYSHKSVTIPGFPNFFLMFGPYSPIGNYSAFSVAETQIEFILALLKQTFATGNDVVEPRADVTKQTCARIQEAAKKTVWLSGCNSWYLDENGRTQMWPYTFEKYVRSMRRPRLEHFVLSKKKNVEESGQVYEMLLKKERNVAAT